MEKFILINGVSENYNHVIPIKGIIHVSTSRDEKYPRRKSQIKVVENNSCTILYSSNSADEIYREIYKTEKEWN